MYIIYIEFVNITEKILFFVFKIANVKGSIASFIFFIAYNDILTYQYHRYIKITNCGAVSN